MRNCDCALKFDVPVTDGMTSAQTWMVVTLVLLVVGRLIQAVTTRHGVGEALLNFGVPAVVAAAAGGLSVLIQKAQVLQDVTSIDKRGVVSAGDRLEARDLTELGDRLLLDAIYIYGVFAIVIGVILFEIKIGNVERGRAPIGALGWGRYVGLGFVVPAFFGVSALYAVYIRS